MKHGYFLGFLVVVLMLGQGTVIQVEADNGFVKTSGLQLMLNGSPYYANGFNAYWLMYVASDPSQRSNVSSAFQEATNHGLNIARTWAFSHGGYRPLQYSPGSYDEQMFQAALPFHLHRPPEIVMVAEEGRFYHQRKRSIWFRRNFQSRTLHDPWSDDPTTRTKPSDHTSYYVQNSNY